MNKQINQYIKRTDKILIAKHLSNKHKLVYIRAALNQLQMDIEGIKKCK